MSDNFVSIGAKECARILNVHYDTIKRAVYSQQLKGYRVGLRKLRTPEYCFKEYLNNLGYFSNQPQMKDKIKNAIEVMKIKY